MIKLFRNIRKSLLKEGKTTNYLKYAIGEIVLVVIGILIALQINNWNEYRKNESNTTLMLKQLKEENLSNLSDLLEGKPNRDSLSSKTRFFINFLRNTDSINNIERTKFHLSFQLQSESYSFTENALIRYLNSNVNENSALIKELIELQSYQKNLTYISEKAMDSRFDNVFNFLINDVDYSTLEIHSLDKIKSFEFRNKLNLTLVIESAVNSQFYKTLKQEQKVDSILSNYLKNKNS
ncbi:MAG: DUF6090 family protein [Flavobacteriaceae bacterium]